MRVHINTKLYGGEFLQDIENYFDLNDEKYIVDTWKVLVSYKRDDRFGYWETLTDKAKMRFENVLWRKWYMNYNKCSKINFDMGLIPVSRISGQIVIVD